MGLDAVEIVMRVEKTFAIEIKDAEAEDLSTVGDMHELVWSKIDGRVSDTCVSQSIFYRLRSEMKNTYGIDRTAIIPGAALTKMIPSDQTQEQWLQFARAANLKLPELVYRQPYSIIKHLLTVNMVVCTILPFFFAIQRSDWWLLLLCPASYAISVGFHKIFEGKKTAAPRISIRQFVAQVLALNFENLKNMKGEMLHINRQEMERVINNLIVDVLGVDIKDVSPEKSFVKDLGV